MLHNMITPAFSNNLFYKLSDNSLQLGILFTGCAIYSEMDRQPTINECFKTNLRLASGLLITSSFLNMYRINFI